MRRLALLLSISTMLVLLAGCNWLRTPLLTPGPTARYLYVTSTSGDMASILTYDAHASTAAPVTPLSSTTPIHHVLFEILRTDAAGNLYTMAIVPGVDNAAGANSNPTIHVFSSNNGVLTEIRSFSYQLQGEVYAMTPGPDGTVYLAGTNNLNGQDNNIYVFPPTASGVTTPSLVINLPTREGTNFMVTDAAGNLYANILSSHAIYKYAPGFTTATPAAQMLYTGALFDFEIGSNGHFYIDEQIGNAQDGSPVWGVSEFDSFGAAIPSRVIVLPGAGDGGGTDPTYIAVDCAGYVYVEYVNFYTVFHSNIQAFAKDNSVALNLTGSPGQDPTHGYGGFYIQ